LLRKDRNHALSRDDKCRDADWKNSAWWNSSRQPKKQKWYYL